MYIEAESCDLRLTISDLTFDGEFEDALEKANEQALNDHDEESLSDPVLYEVEDFTFNLYDTPSFIPETEVHYTSLPRWFEVMEALDSSAHNFAALQYLIEEEGHDPYRALGMMDNVMIIQGDLESVAREDIEQSAQVPDYLLDYFDFQRYGDDQNWCQFRSEYDNEDYVVLNHSNY